jgi:glycosidase
VLKNAQYIADTFHGYGIQDFLEVDPRFASSNDPESELQRLIDDAHARGIYVIFDIVLNHAGDLFAYVLDNGDSASEATFRDRIYPIRWRDQAGTPREDWPEPPGDAPRDGVVWPIELQQNRFFRRQGRGGEGGGDFSLPQGAGHGRAAGAQHLDPRLSIHYRPI